MLNYYGTLVDIEDLDGTIHHFPIGSFFIVNQPLDDVDQKVRVYAVKLISVLYITVHIDHATYKNLVALLRYNPNSDCPVLIKNINS